MSEPKILIGVCQTCSTEDVQTAAYTVYTERAAKQSGNPCATEVIEQCEVCASTYVGNIAHNPKLYPDTDLNTVRIMAQIENLRAKRVNEILARIDTEYTKQSILEQAIKQSATATIMHAGEKSMPSTFDVVGGTGTHDTPPGVFAEWVNSVEYKTEIARIKAMHATIKRDIEMTMGDLWQAIVKLEKLIK